MSDNLFSLQKLQSRYEELAAQLASSSLDVSQRHRAQKEFSYLSTILAKYREIETYEHQVSELQGQMASHSELRELFIQEVDLLNERIVNEKRTLENLMFPADEMDERSVFLEIRPGTGGQEAALFVGDLLRMYTLYSQKMGWRVSIVSAIVTDLGGYREVVLHIEGKSVYGHLKFESGVHRVQRVPATETAGRIHTSTVTIAVLPEVANDAEITIAPSDLRIDVYRSGGAGGQHVNTTDSAVRITHLPTGLVVTCQDERSQHKNKAKAFKVLQSRLLSLQKEKLEREMSQKRKELVGTGERSEKVRTYNFPQNRITDHQVNLTLKKLDMVLEGDLDDIIEALMAHYREELRKSPPSFLT
jgi:peptide chain release factor 1